MSNPSTETEIPVTREFVFAVSSGVRGIRHEADAIARDPATKADTSTGRMLRAGVEERRLQADMLAGWVRRVMGSLSLSESEEEHLRGI